MVSITAVRARGWPVQAGEFHPPYRAPQAVGDAGKLVGVAGFAIVLVNH
jgi:hypothetical protein